MGERNLIIDDAPTGSNGFRDAMADRDLIDAIVEVGQAAPRVASVCSGAFLLAEALADALASEFPTITVVPDEIY